MHIIPHSKYMDASSRCCTSHRAWLTSIEYSEWISRHVWYTERNTKIMRMSCWNNSTPPLYSKSEIYPLYYFCVDVPIIYYSLRFMNDHLNWHTWNTWSEARVCKFRTVSIEAWMGDSKVTHKIEWIIHFSLFTFFIKKTNHQKQTS